MKYASKYALRETHSLQRGLAIMLSFILAAMPPAPSARAVSDCCGGGATNGGNCGEKWTFVTYVLGAFCGKGMTSIVGTYEDDNSIAFQHAMSLHKDLSKQECGSFCSQDGRVIRLKLTLSGKPTSSGFGASFNATWGCSGKTALSKWTDSLKGGVYIVEDKMSTGESNGCSGSSCPIGSGNGSNGSVHFEWYLGSKLNAAPSASALDRDPSLPRMLLSLDNLAGVSCTPALLRIPKMTYLHVVQLVKHQSPLPDIPLEMGYYATDAEASAVFPAELLRWRSEMALTDSELVDPENPTNRGYSTAEVVPLSGADGILLHPGDSRLNLSACEWVRVGGEVRQIRTSAGLLVFEDPAGLGSFLIRLYSSSQYSVAGHVPGAEYPLIGTPAPVRTWRVMKEDVNTWDGTEPTFVIAPGSGVETPVEPGEIRRGLPSCEHVLVGGAIRQVLTGNSLVDFEQLVNSFRIRFYESDQIDRSNHVPGTLFPLAGVIPVRTWLVEKSTASSIHVTEESATPVRSTVWTQTAGAWEMSEDGGNSFESKQVGALAGGGTEKTVEKRDAAHVALSRTISRFDLHHRLVWSSEGLGTEAITTDYHYPADPAGKLGWMQRSDGYFEKYSYAGDPVAPPYTVTVIRPWLDVAFASADASNARLTETRTEITDKDTSDEGTLVTTTEKIAGSVVSRTRRWTQTSMTNHTNFGLQPVTTETVRLSARDASGALQEGNETRRETFGDGAPGMVRGRPICEIQADGTKTTWVYLRGHFNGDEPIEPGAHKQFMAVADGPILEIRERRDVSPFNMEVAGRTRENRQYLDLAHEGVLVLEESGVYLQVGSYTPVQRTFYQYDLRQHLTGTTVTSADEMTQRVTYHAVYVDDRLTSQTDETGVTTTYSNFDVSGNPKREIREALTGLPALVTEREFDLWGRLKSESQQTAVGAPALQTRTTLFDSRGRLTSETAHGLTTTLAYPAGSEARTTPGAGIVTTTYYNDGQVKQMSGLGVVTTSYGYNIVNGLVRETVTRGSGNETVVSLAERNGLGQTVREKMAAPGNAWRIFKYDAAGRVVSEWIDGTQTRAVGYGAAGNQSETVFAMPDPARSFGSSEAFVQEGMVMWRERRASDGSVARERMNPGALLSQTQQRAAHGRTLTTTTSVNAAAVTATTVDSAVGLPAVTVSQGGVVVSAKTPEKPLPVTYSYDALGRPVTVTDTATGAVTAFTYDPATGQVASTTTTSGGAGTSTVNTYYTAAETAAGQVPGRLKTRTVDGVVTAYTYTPRGELATVNGATYPLKYAYDAAGRLWKLHTYQAEPGANLGETGNVTTWVYVPGTTLLAQKLDAAGKGALYGYDEKGRLQTRTWARTLNGQAGGPPLTTTYTYNLAGDMKHLDYGDGTPDVTLAYDARGRLVQRTDGTGVTTLGYHGETGQVADETGTDGSRLHREADGAGRETGYYLWAGGRFVTWGGWDYAAATGKVNGAMTDAGWVSYTDTEQANLSTHATMLSGTNVQTVAQRNGLGRLQSLSTLAGNVTPTPLAGRRYDYTPEGRVWRVKEGSTANGGTAWTDTGHWEYGYDDKGRGQVEEGKKFALVGSTATALPGMRRGYRYDAIGNRVELKVNTLDNDWVANGLNQIASRSVEGKQYVLGEANPVAALTVTAEGDQLYSSEGLSPKVAITREPGNWFSAKINTENAAQAKNLRVTVTEQVGTAQAREAIGHLFVPASREVFTHDADGNLTRDGHWTYEWDAENRLVAVETRHDLAAAGPDALPVLRLEFSYDALSRRVGKRVYESVGGNSWVPVRTVKFAYEGWNLIAESEPLSGFPVTYNTLRTYQWGTDLSDTRQGAGGVGGLLLITQHHSTNNIQHATSLYPCYGDNGNIAALLDVSDPQAGVTVAASYEYGPFGEPLRATGPMARANPFRFSTKYTDDETEMVYYGYRFYDPHIGRWSNRDPMNEVGGVNLYAFVSNNPSKTVDLLGLAECLCEYVKSIDLPTPDKSFIGKTTFGFQLEWSITLGYRRCTGEYSAATLRYFELPEKYTPNPAEPVGVWTDGYKTTGGDDAPPTTSDMFYNWRNRDFALPTKRAKLQADTTRVVKLKDDPARYKTGPGSWSELSISLEVANSKGCLDIFPNPKGLFSKWHGIFHFKESALSREIKGTLLKHNENLP